MKYKITCVCGEDVFVDAENDNEATTKMIAAMDEHIAAKEHPSVPKDLTQEQKEGMVRQQMKKS